MLEPIFITVATAVAGKAALDLYQLVRERLARDPDAHATLEAAEDRPGDPELVRVLAEEIARAARLDPDFDQAVREAAPAPTGPAASAGEATEGGVVNQISGSAVGKAVQARDVQGDVNL